MDKRRVNWVACCVVAVMVLAVAVVLKGTTRRTAHITLPSPTETESGRGDLMSDTLTVVEVTPKTVQAAIETLSRPTAYARTITVEQFWDGGSASYSVDTVTADGWTRTERTLSGGRIRRTITNGETTYLWYNGDREAMELAAGDISADAEQSILTYEEILELPVSAIHSADYRSLSGIPCIYVETEPDEYGYISRYWVSLETGLLTVSERLQGENTVYRMAALAVELSPQITNQFTLPGGRDVLAIPEDTNDETPE